MTDDTQRAQFHKTMIATAACIASKASPNVYALSILRPRLFHKRLTRHEQCSTFARAVDQLEPAILMFGTYLVGSFSVRDLAA